MLTPQDVVAAEATLGRIIETFRAAVALQEALQTVKTAVIDYANVQDETRKAEANLVAVKDSLARARNELAEARIEKEKVDKAAALVKAELKKLGI